MFGRLTGVVVERSIDGSCTLDVRGVGYEIAVPLSAIPALPEPPTEVTLAVHTHVREDQIALYGFPRAADREAFRVLLGVSGVGPKVALAILGVLSAKELALAISREDAAAFRPVPGVGKKLSERLLLELKDKLSHLVTSTALPAQRPKDGPPAPVPTGPRAEVARILIGLGFKPPEAERAVSMVDVVDDRPIEELVREALGHAR